MIRLQFEVPEDKFKVIEALMDVTHLRTKIDLFNNALALFEWAVGEMKAGRSIASIDVHNNIFRELVMPALSSVLVEKPTDNNDSGS